MKSSFKIQAIMAVVILAIGIALGGFLIQKNPADFSIEQNNEKAKDIAGQTKNSLARQNPPDKDSDRDGLADWEEAIYKTDPMNPDSDNDGYLDGEEVAAGYNPKSAAADDKLIILPKDSEIKTSQQSGQGVIEKYLLSVRTPNQLKDPNVYQTAIAESLEGKTEKIDIIILQLKDSYQTLKNIAAPQEAAEIHKLTLGLMPEIIGIFENLKKIKGDPSKLMASLEKANSLAPLVDVLDKKIKNLAEKYQIAAPLQ